MKKKQGIYYTPDYLISGRNLPVNQNNEVVGIEFKNCEFHHTLKKIQFKNCIFFNCLGVYHLENVRDCYAYDSQ